MMLKGALAHLIAAVLAGCSGMWGLGWTLSREDAYQGVLETLGRSGAWVSIAYIVLGFVLYGSAFRRRASPPPTNRSSNSWAGWALQLAGAVFALASSTYMAASAKRGPMGDFRGLGYILLGLAILGLLAGSVIQLLPARADPGQPH